MQNNELKHKNKAEESLLLSVHFHTEVGHVLALHCDWKQDSFPSCCALAEYDIPAAKCFSYRLNEVCFQHIHTLLSLKPKKCWVSYLNYIVKQAEGFMFL